MKRLKAVECLSSISSWTSSGFSSRSFVTRIRVKNVEVYYNNVRKYLVMRSRRGFSHMITRRIFLQTLALVTLYGYANSVFALDKKERVLDLYNTHTGERLDIK